MTITLAVITSGTALLLAARSLVAASCRIDRMLADIDAPAADEPAVLER